MTDLALTDTLSNASEKFDQRKNLRPWPRAFQAILVVSYRTASATKRYMVGSRLSSAS